MKNFYLVLNRCEHGETYISIDDDNEAGVRLTTWKCCNRSTTAKKWLLTDINLSEAIIAFGNALEDRNDD